MGKYTAIYARVSSKGQATKSQMPDLEHFVSCYEGECQWFEDVATGKSMDRHAWQRIEEEIKLRKVEQVVVWRLDRLGRTASGLTDLFERLNQNRINLVSIKDGLDLSTAAGRLMANVLASVAQFETELRGERVRAGQQAARAQGKRWGGSIGGKRKKVSPTQIKGILQMKKDGESITQIAAAFQLSRPTIYDVLKGQLA